jgi:hypothetical protein
MADGINTFNENPLHKGLKEWAAGPEAAFEVPLEGYIIDAIVDGVLIEVQTRNFGAMRKKLQTLVESHPVRLVHPVSFEKWIVRVDPDGVQLSRRKSPKRGRMEEVFSELVTFPKLMSERNFSLEVVMIQEEEIRLVDGKKHGRRRRRDFVREERRLVSVLDSRRFVQPRDMAGLIPESVGEPFTTSDIAKGCNLPRFMAQKMAYCLREMGAIVAGERKKKGIQYVRSAENATGVEIGATSGYEPIGVAT